MLEVCRTELLEVSGGKNGLWWGRLTGSVTIAGWLSLMLWMGLSN